jgi:hypothetical protein
MDVSRGAPLLGNIEWRSFLRAFQIKKYIKIYVKMFCKRVFFSIGAPLGNLLAGTFWEKREVYLDYFLGTRGY